MIIPITDNRGYHTREHTPLQRPITDNNHTDSHRPTADQRNAHMGGDTQSPDTADTGQPGGTDHFTPAEALQYGQDWDWDNQEEVLDHQSVTILQEASPEQMNSLEEKHPEIRLNKQVRAQGYPNRWGARIPIKPNWNLQLFENLLQGYTDIEIIEWMKYGWPIGRLPTLQPPDITFKNHKGATDYPEALDKYVVKESSHNAIIGPLEHIPFTEHLGISPLSTRPKKDSDDRRIILDLSFPPGRSVNDGMIKDNYLGFITELTFPKTDQFAHRIYILGKGALMFKIDLHRYFRQLDLDPGDYSLIGYIIQNKLYFDKMVPMGVRTGPYIAQRVSSAITWIVQQVQYFLLNYVDDFVGAELQAKAWEAYHFLTKLLRDLSVQTSPEKIVPPTTRLEFLGTTFDSIKMTMEIPTTKLKEIKLELQRWSQLTCATRKEIESLVGKLQFAARCVRPGRIFLSRIINWLRETTRKGKFPIPQEAREDINWWHRFIDQYNGISILWLETTPQPDHLMATDANLTGFGGISDQEYFKGQFPRHLKGCNIAILELWAVMVAVKTWAKKFQGKYFWIHVDNEAVATILNTGASRLQELQAILRKIAYIAATHQFVIKAKHIEGVTNRIPDWLSRWKDPAARKKFNRYAREKSLKRLKIEQEIFFETKYW